MTKREFLMALNDALYPLSEDERSAAVKYYSDYIDDAGEGDLDKVLSELGSPQQVAASIKADSEIGRSIPPAPPAPPPAGPGGAGSRRQGTAPTGPEITRSGLPGWLVVLLVLLLIPVWAPLLMAALGLLIGIFGLFLGIFAAAAGLVFAGVWVAVSGLIALPAGPLVGVLVLGVGLILLGIGLLFGILAVFLCTVVLPALLRGIGWVCRAPFRRQGSGGAY